MDLLGLQLVLTCQHVDCDAQEVLEITKHETARACMAAAVADGLIEDGWGHDQNGVDLVLHCPEHRS